MIEMNLISLETATDVCSVALMQGSHVVVELTLNRPRAHAENLIPLIQDALSYGGIGPKDLHAVAVSMGPGSYTGLRIGVSAAKGLAVALDTALIGIPTLEALAASVVAVAHSGDIICAALNARRDEVYAAAFQVTERAGVPVAETAALRVDALPDWLDAPDDVTIWVAGDGTEKAAGALRERYGAAVQALDPGLYAPSAGWVARLAMPRLARGETEDVTSFEPFYLKDFVAKKRERSIFERLPF